MREKEIRARKGRQDFPLRAYFDQQIFPFFTKQQRLADATGKRLFLKEKRAYHKQDMLEISHTYLKRFLYRRVLALLFASDQRGKIYQLRSILKTSLLKRILKDSSIGRKKGAASSFIEGESRQRSNQEAQTERVRGLGWETVLKKANGKYGGRLNIRGGYIDFERSPTQHKLMALEDL